MLFNLLITCATFNISLYLYLNLNGTKYSFVSCYLTDAVSYTYPILLNVS